MIKIPENIVDSLFVQGRSEAPNEACGYLAGKDGLVKKHYEMRNVDQSPTHFTLDPEEQFKVIREARDEGLKILAVYHTHPESAARPSKEDIRLAFDPDISYVILSLLPGERDMGSFKIRDGKVVREFLEIL